MVPSHWTAADISQELAEIELDIPWRQEQVTAASAALEAQVTRTHAVYGNSYPASSHHAIGQLRERLAACEASLADGYEWRKELQEGAAA